MKDSKKKQIGFQYALNGIWQVVRTERNFRIHIFIFLLVVIFGFCLQLTAVQWCLVLGVSGLVFVAEMINTTVERLIDYMKPEIHPQAKAIKDIAAGAVLMAALTAAVIGLLVFIPKFLHLLH
ncbi:diacylglycerol kinase family protein [Virgibacillus halophilus]|uniref:Diacylglycerol kinase family protein n=1 Tax=Tigheibacillus halophilus TaxID=361280 RepID=A0ABU5CBP3_9BACI|nr:diacylglycerol kinase family protein [Virgibacillus halophilus]